MRLVILNLEAKKQIDEPPKKKIKADLNWDALALIYLKMFKNAMESSRQKR